MALYSIALSFDSAGTAKLLDLMCGSYMFENQIRPHLTLGMFESDSEKEVLSYFLGLVDLLEPFTLTFGNMGMFGSSYIFAEPMADPVMKENFYKTYSIFSKHFTAGDNGNYLPGRWVPHVSVGMKLSEEESQGYFEFAAENFRSFSCVACRAVVARCDPYKELFVKPLKQKKDCALCGGFADDDDRIPDEDFFKLRLGMSPGEAEFVLNKALVLQRFDQSGYSYDYVKLREGVWLFFRTGDHRLYSIRFNAPFFSEVCGGAIGMTRMQLLNAKGAPDRYGEPGREFYSDTWLYDNEIDGAVLRFDFESDPAGVCVKIFIL